MLFVFFLFGHWGEKRETWNIIKGKKSYMASQALELLPPIRVHAFKLKS